MKGSEGDKEPVEPEKKDEKGEKKTEEPKSEDAKKKDEKAEEKGGEKADSTKKKRKAAVDDDESVFGQVKEYWKKMEENDPSGWKIFLAGVSAIVVGLSVPYYLLSGTNTTEINMQQLKQELLANNKLTKVKIDCNRELALIFVDDSPNPEYHIQIGEDFGAFERQLEGAEVELGLPETLIQYDWNSFDL